MTFLEEVTVALADELDLPEHEPHLTVLLTTEQLVQDWLFWHTSGYGSGIQHEQTVEVLFKTVTFLHEHCPALAVMLVVTLALRHEQLDLIIGLT